MHVRHAKRAGQSTRVHTYTHAHATSAGNVDRVCECSITVGTAHGGGLALDFEHHRYAVARIARKQRTALHSLKIMVNGQIRKDASPSAWEFVEGSSQSLRSPPSAFSLTMAWQGTVILLNPLNE